MATMYHGTASTYLPSILTEGLHPVESNRWNVAMPGLFFDWNPSEQEKGEHKVFLASKLDEAQGFAQIRALYLRARAKQTIKFATFVPMVKQSTVPHDIKAKPKVLEITIPDNWKLESDIKSGGWYTERIIPASYIKRVLDIDLQLTTKPRSKHV
jgi:hypothetical protein